MQYQEEYEEAVAEFRVLDESIEEGQWRQAQITWENAGWRGADGKPSLRTWAAAVGKSIGHVTALYWVWERWGKITVGRPTFADAYRMATTDAESPEEASAIKDANRATSSLGKLPAKSRAAIIREHLADPEVARETFNAPEPDDETAATARMHAGSAISRHDQRVQEHIREKRHGEAIRENRTDQEAMYEVSAMMQVLADVVVTGGNLAHKLSEGATLSSGMRHTLAGYATKAKATIEWLQGIEDQQHAEDVDEVLRVWAAES